MNRIKADGFIFGNGIVGRVKKGHVIKRQDGPVAGKIDAWIPAKRLRE